METKPWGPLCPFLFAHKKAWAPHSADRPLSPQQEKQEAGLPGNRDFNICKRLLLHPSQGHFTSPGRALLCQHSGQGQPAASRHVAGCARLAPRPRCLGLGIQAVNKAIMVIHVLFSAFHHDNVVSELGLDGRVCVHGLVHAAHRQGKRCLLEWSHHGASGHPAQVSLQEGTVGVKL